MCFFDERVLAKRSEMANMDVFTALMGEAGSSHKTLQQHLDRLACAL
jgi:hypothetical protein